MKRKIDVFWYWFLIIVAFVICFMFSSVKANAATIGGEIPGDVNDPGTSEEANLYEQCHTYITTNIISAESLTEALNGKIYADFTQEDCMEMINIASKREVIKNVLNLSSVSSSNNGISYKVEENIILNGTAAGSASIYFNNLNIVSETYTVSIQNITGSFTGNYYINFFNSSGSEVASLNNNKNVFTFSNQVNRIQIYISNGSKFENFNFNLQLEKGSSKTPYVSYDYHREYYEEGIDYADNRVNTNSSSYTQGVTDADNRVNADSVNYKTGLAEGYERANEEGKILGDFIPSLLGGFGSFFLTLLNIDILGFNLLTVLGILITVLGIVVVIKFLKG